MTPVLQLEGYCFSITYTLLRLCVVAMFLIQLIEVEKSILNVGTGFYELNSELHELNISIEAL